MNFIQFQNMFICIFWKMLCIIWRIRSSDPPGRPRATCPLSWWKKKGCRPTSALSFHRILSTTHFFGLLLPKSHSCLPWRRQRKMELSPRRRRFPMSPCHATCANAITGTAPKPSFPHPSLLCLLPPTALLAVGQLRHQRSPSSPTVASHPSTCYKLCSHLLPAAIDKAVNSDKIFF
jgi:hypothetical protein